MKTLRLRISHFLAICILLTTVIQFASCSRRGDIIPSSEFAPYISAYTGGVISRTSPIRVELAQEPDVVEVNSVLKDCPFRFSPSVKGKAYWVSGNTIEFMPDEGALKPGELYEATFDLGSIIDVDKKFKRFKFSFRVQQRSFKCTFGQITIGNGDEGKVALSGELSFSDDVTEKQVGDMLSVRTKSGKNALGLKPTVRQSGGNRNYSFTFNDIPRNEKDYEIEVVVDGSAFGSSKEQKESFAIPARGQAMDFVAACRIDQPENGLQIVFSNPVDPNQDLKGLIEIPQAADYVYQVDQNKVNIFFDQTDNKAVTLNVHAGVRNIYGQSNRSEHTVSFSELSIKPQIVLDRQAAIIPDFNNLSLPFRAANLYAVDVKVIRIFENNILMFLQNNTLGSNYELRRAGRLVYKKTLNLTDDATKDIHQWNDYSVDLSGVINKQPGAIYRIVFSFKKSYSAYPCGGDRSDTEANNYAESMVKVNASSLSDEDQAVWDQPNSYYWDTNDEEANWRDYRWDQQDNPCDVSYYMSGKTTAGCNVLASNIGVMVKRNSTGKVWVMVNSIMDTKPIGNANITVYNYQLQPVGTGATNGSGIAEIDVKGGAFVVVAESDKQKGYVRVVDGEELSTSRFDVGGQEIAKGLKGFIYGDRGVWRPGDTIHLSFMLEDMMNRIPDKHPVTLEVFNSRGQFHSKRVATNGLNGLYTFDVVTQSDNPTGVWSSYVKVGGATFHKSLRVETIKPNRLKINLRLPERVIEASQGVLNTELSASWLTGAKAGGLKAKIEMNLSKSKTQFAGYEAYEFNDPASDFQSFTSELYSGVLNADGNAAVQLKLPEARNAAGMLKADVTTRVFEPGGDASISVQTVPYSPFSSYVGVALDQAKGKSVETDTDHQFRVVTLSPEGKPVSRQNLVYRVYKIDWNWWWNRSEQSLSSYVNNTSIKPVAAGRISTSNGKGQFSFRVNYPEWGRYLVYVKDVESGHASGGVVYFDWPEWRGRAGKDDPTGLKMLAFSVDKGTYQLGETVTAVIPASSGGRALVAIEDGSTVLQQEWIELTEGKDTKYKFKVTSDMAPNVYLHVVLLQPYAQTVNDLPIRMYGVVPVFVVDKATVLEPQIAMPDVLRPQTQFSVKVSEKNGKPMTYTLAIVDEGLLDISNFRTPNPWNTFYAREALGIRTWDMYDDVLNATAGKFGSLFSIGGDETLRPSDAKANRFRPVVKFLGPFALGRGRSQTHNITLPMYVGSVRTMVVAGQDGAYGSAEKATPVRTPLMVLATLPRVASVGDEILMPVNVFVTEKGVRDVTVEASTSGLLTMTDGTRKSISFSEPGDGMVYFKLKTSGKVGREVVKIKALGGGQTASETIEIEVRNPNPMQITRTSEVLDPGEKRELSYQIYPNSSERSVKLELSRIPSIDLAGIMDFMYNYEYQCTEQIVSRALPMLCATSLTKFTAEQAQQMKDGVTATITALYTRQMPSGGFAYWPMSEGTNDWVTSYAGMFLSLAKERGYAVSESVMAKWRRYQQISAQNWSAQSDNPFSQYLQAYRLYTLALAGVPELGAMNRLKEVADLSLQARWQLADAYAVNGKSKVANELLFNADMSIGLYSSNNMTYGSSYRDEAMILETLVQLGRMDEAMTVAKRVSQNLSSRKRYDTQTAAWSVWAMSRLADKLSGEINCEWGSGAKNGSQIKSPEALVIEQLDSKKSGNIWVKNSAKGVLCVDLVTAQRPLIDSSVAVASGLQMSVKYAKLNGEPIDVISIKQGVDFVSIVTVTNNNAIENYSNLALTHIIPAGWEIFNERLVVGDDPQRAPYTYRDIRDDRVYTYFDLARGETKHFEIRLQATYAGRYVLPAVLCEAMYDVNVFARTAAGRVVVEQ